MKKLIAFLFVCGFAFAFVACGGAKTEEAATDEAATEEVAPAEEEAPADEMASDSTSMDAETDSTASE